MKKKFLEVIVRIKDLDYGPVKQELELINYLKLTSNRERREIFPCGNRREYMVLVPFLRYRSSHTIYQTLKLPKMCIWGGSSGFDQLRRSSVPPRLRNIDGQMTKSRQLRYFLQTRVECRTCID